MIKILRPLQWVKNAFVFLPMFFGGHILDSFCWRQSIVAFFAFSFAASAIYCLNDAIDVEADRKHPVKRLRPVASGAVSVATAIVLSGVCAAAAFALCLPAGRQFVWPMMAIIAIYLVVNVAYCLKLKQVSIIDVMLVAIGFVLRLVIGGVACDIWLSPWIVSLTFLLALLLAFAKRRDDLVIAKDGEEMRRSVRDYNVQYLDVVLGALAAITIVCYVMYTLSAEVVARIGSEYLYVTSIFVIGGILRYLQVTIVSEHSGSPTKVLLRDWFIQAMIICWIITFLFLLYI